MANSVFLPVGSTHFSEISFSAVKTKNQIKLALQIAVSLSGKQGFQS